MSIERVAWTSGGRYTPLNATHRFSAQHGTADPMRYTAVSTQMNPEDFAERQPITAKDIQPGARFVQLSSVNGKPTYTLEIISLHIPSSQAGQTQDQTHHTMQTSNVVAQEAETRHPLRHHMVGYTRYPYQAPTQFKHRTLQLAAQWFHRTGLPKTEYDPLPAVLQALLSGDYYRFDDIVY